MPELPEEWLAAPELDALADWIDDELASGTPPKWVAQQAANAVRHVAGQIRAVRRALGNGQAEGR